MGCIKIRWFCVEKVKIESLKGKIFNFNENNENHKCVKYHRSCYKSYTGKHNLTRYSHETVSKQENTDSARSNTT
jgi:hypothetical protein